MVNPNGRIIFQKEIHSPHRRKFMRILQYHYKKGSSLIMLYMDHIPYGLVTYEPWMIDGLRNCFLFSLERLIDTQPYKLNG